MNRKLGFTLAEVLVTLMIIGVIAAITIPSLMQSTSSQEYKVAFKKAVSSINQAITMNYALEGEDASSYTCISFLNMLTNRLNVITKEANSVYTADGMHYRAISGGSAVCGACSVDDGNICSVIQVDVNGRKGPNKMTTSTNKVFDMFTVNIYAQKVLPGNDTFSEILYSK